MLGDDTIHGVTNPREGLTGAIHVYGGDFVNQPRSQWGPGPLDERPYDIEDVRRQFATANAAWRAGERSGSAVSRGERVWHPGPSIAGNGSQAVAGAMVGGRASAQQGLPDEG